MKRLLGDIFVLITLALAAVLYCNRFYGAGFTLEGDSLFWVYLRLNADLLKNDHNPYIYYYASHFNWTGPLNLLVAVIIKLVSYFYPATDETAKAVLVCMWAGFVSTTALSWSIYGTARYLGLKKAGAALAALIVPYTGFSTVAIREFSIVYHVSFIMVGPAIICALELHRTLNYLRWIPLLALTVGASLLSGSNVPMFYYLPLLLLLPILFPAISARNRIKLIAAELSAMAFAFLVAAASLFPALRSLYDSKRGDSDFVSPLPSSPPAHKMMNVFFRDWWTPGAGSFHEQDCFLGVSVVCLAVWGMICLWKKPTASPTQRAAFRLLSIFLLWAVVVMHHSFLPSLVHEPIRKFYNLLSIRNSNRFFLLALLPIAIFAATGLEKLGGLRSLLVLLIGLLVQQWLIHTQLLPRMDLVIPDVRLAATLGIGIGYAALLILALLTVRRTRMNEKLRPVLDGMAVFTVYAVFFFAPIQLSGYTLPYHDQPELLELADQRRLHWMALIGWRDRYRETFSLARDYLITPPPYLTDPATLHGRIFDPNSSAFLRNGHFNFFAPKTGHQFVFPLTKSDTTSKHMFDLYSLHSESVFDLAGVCWKIPESQSRRISLIGGKIYPYKTFGPALHRPSCLPPGLLVRRFLPLGDDKQVLEWLRLSTRDDFQREIAVNCREVDCAKYQDYIFKEGDKFQSLANYVEPRALLPGKFEILATSPQPTFLFLSTLYHPDWRAEVNGKSAPVFRANHAFMAVPLGSGISEIKLIFTGLATLWGRCLTLGASLLLLAAWALSLPRRSPVLTRLFAKIRLPISAKAS